MEWLIMRGTYSPTDGEYLRKASLKNIRNEVLHPLDASLDVYRQLQLLYAENKEEYKRRIRLFPFIKCGLFNPRKSILENFTSISCFVLPIGRLEDPSLLNELRERIQQDKRTLLLYQSPNGNGLNVFFGFSSPCYDAAHFYHFYLKFGSEFAQEYGLKGKISKNAAQANYRCYLAYDPLCYYNPDPELQDWERYIQKDSPGEEIHVIKETLPLKKEETNFEADERALDFIHKQLGIKSKHDKKKEEEKKPIDISIYMFSLFELYAKHRIQVLKTERMTFGNIVTLKKGKLTAHIKIYAGKERVVAQYAPMNNTDIPFCEECKKLTQGYFNSKIRGNESE